MILYKIKKKNVRYIDILKKEQKNNKKKKKYTSEDDEREKKRRKKKKKKKEERKEREAARRKKQHPSYPSNTADKTLGNMNRGPRSMPRSARAVKAVLALSSLPRRT
jgi:hypothetical protein